MKTNQLLLAALLAVASCHSDAATTPAQPAAVQTPQHGTVPIDGVDYYYEIHGPAQRSPILVLHGGLMSIATSRPVIDELAKTRTVIAVDLQGHGRTTLGTRPITLVDSANDLDVLLGKLGYAQVDVLGYSFGGGIAFRLAVQHPERVRKLVITSAPFARDGWYADMLPQQEAVNASLAPMMKDTPIYKSYAAVAPHPEDFPRLLDRMGELMRTPYDYAADAKHLKVPTMLVFGDADMVTPEHMIAFYKLLGGGQRDAGWQREHMPTNRLAILPDVTHYEMFDSPRLATAVLPFLDGKPAQVSTR